MKKVFLIITAICLIAAISVPVFAADSRVVDDASLLTGGEAQRLEMLLDEISLRQNVDIVVVTTESTDGKSPMEYADDFFDYHDYAKDGVLLLVSMEEHDWWVSTTGYGITAITDAGLEYISDRFVPELSDGDYYDAFVSFAEDCDQFITQARTAAPYDNSNLPKEPFDFSFSLIISLVVGLVVALIVTSCMRGQLKSVRFKAQADDYITPGSMQVTHSRDLFLYTHLDRREKPKSTSGSSTHMSSSGSFHGGGGGKF